MGVRGPRLEPWPRATGSHQNAASHLPRRLAPWGSYISSFALACTPGAFPSVPPSCTPGVFGPLRLVGGCRRSRMCTIGCGGLGFGAQARAHTQAAPRKRGCLRIYGSTVPSCQSAFLFQKRSPNCLSCAPWLCSGSSRTKDRAERQRSAAADRRAPSASVVQLVGGGQQTAARARGLGQPGPPPAAILAEAWRTQPPLRRL